MALYFLSLFSLVRHLKIILYSSVDISKKDIEEHIAFLASEELKGREAGTADEAKAANYIADLFRNSGLEPAGDDQTFSGIHN